MRDFCPDMIIVKVNMQHKNNKNGNEFDMNPMNIHFNVIGNLLIYIILDIDRTTFL